MNDQAIGVFDSGIGGLTVFKEITQVLPHESIIYLGDTARVPYGTRSKEAITNFALEMVKFLLKKKVKVLVVACNTISATCFTEIKSISPVPVLGVIEPVVNQAVKNTKTQVIGVLGTKATISSGIYGKMIKDSNPSIKVISQSCPLFVPLVEEGFTAHPATEIIAREYLDNLLSTKMDTLVLGCTHYPLLSETINNIVGQGVALVDSAEPTARDLKRLLKEKNLLRRENKLTHEFFVTDAPERVSKIAKDFLGKPLPGSLQKVDISQW